MAYLLDLIEILIEMIILFALVEDLIMEHWD